MKRLFVSAAVLPLVWAVGAHAETKISTVTTAPVKTSTAANGQPDSLTIEAAGSVKPTASGVAVTLDSNHVVKNAGEIGFNNVSNATGVLLTGGATGSLTNTGSINLLEDFTGEDADKDGDVDGPFAQGSGRFGIRATGAAPFTGDVSSSGAVTIEGSDSAGISLETRLIGNLTSGGAVTVTGDRSVGVSATSVSGAVKVTGPVVVRGAGSTGLALGDVGGALLIQNTVSASGFRYTTRPADEAVRSKLDADDLKVGGAAVRLTGSVAGGVLLDRPPEDKNKDDKDEDKDGVDDALEGTASLVSFGSAPALDIGGAQAMSLGAVGTGDLAYGVVNKGTVAADGVYDGFAATALRIGQSGGGAVTVQGGFNNAKGAITARAFGAEATGVQLNGSAAVPALRNSGSIEANQNGGKHDARAVVDLSGKLTLVENSGLIQAVVTPKTGETATGKAIALDLSAATAAVTVRQMKVGTDDKPAIVGDVLFGGGDDRFELLAGSHKGALSFGTGADTLILDGGASAAGRLTDTDGRLALDIRDGSLSVSNTDAIAVTSLNLGAKGVLAVTLDPASNLATRFNVAGVASLATGAKIDVALKSLVRTPTSYQVIKAQTLQSGSASVTLAGAPFLYNAALRTDAAQAAVFVDLKPKTAVELGLNRSGSQAFAAVFESLDKDDAIEQAFLGQTTKAGFQNLYDQMLPDHSGGALMSAAAISQAISQATGEPLVIERDAGFGVWAQEILFNIQRDREDAAGFRSKGFGLAAGVDLLGEANALGLSASFVGTDFHDRGAAAGEQISMNVLNGGAYWRLSAGDLQASVRGGLGFVWFDGERRLAGAGLDVRTKADWTGWTADAHAGVSYRLAAGGFYARPELTIDYLRLSEDGYRESGGGAGFDLTVAKRKGDLLTGQAALAVGYRFGEEFYLAPELKVGWRQRLAGDPGKTTARFGSGAPFVLDPEQVFDGGAVARLGLRGGGPNVLYSVDAGGTFERAYKQYDVRATVRFQF